MSNSYLDLIEKHLIEVVESKDFADFDVLKEAMKHSLSAGGKRIRPMLLLKCFELFDSDVTKVLPAACAVEYIHTYSLIHDDLPCMDNDDFRRGKPSCHKVYGEDIALLAGDALQSLAFNEICNCKVPSDRIVKAVSELSHLCGALGMVGGQVIDLVSEGKEVSLKTVLKMYALKTSALLESACVLGAILGGANDTDVQKMRDFALNLGLAFQIKDDLLDVMGEAEKLGKPIGSDSENDKSTAFSLLGAEKAQSEVERYSTLAIEQLCDFGEKADYLRDIVNQLIVREN